MYVNNWQHLLVHNSSIIILDYNKFRDVFI